MSVGLLIAAAMVLVAMLVLLRIVRCYLSDPAAALRLTTHDPAMFPQVMAGRYMFFMLMLLGALATGDLRVLAFVFAGLSFLGFFDAVVYRRAGRSVRKHALAGMGCAGAAMVCTGAFFAGL